MQHKALKFKHAQLQREESCRGTSLLNVKFLQTCMSYESKTSEELDAYRRLLGLLLMI